MLAVGSYNFCHASVTAWRPSIERNRYPQGTDNLLWSAFGQPCMHITLAHVAVPVHAEVLKSQLKLMPCHTCWLWLVMTPPWLRSGTCRCCLRRSCRCDDWLSTLTLFALHESFGSCQR